MFFEEWKITNNWINVKYPVIINTLEKNVTEKKMAYILNFRIK